MDILLVRTVIGPTLVQLTGPQLTGHTSKTGHHEQGVRSPDSHVPNASRPS